SLLKVAMRLCAFAKEGRSQFESETKLEPDTAQAAWLPKRLQKLVAAPSASAAVASAITAAATAAAVSAAATTATAAGTMPATAASAAALLRARFVDLQGAAFDFHAVKFANGF